MPPKGHGYLAYGMSSNRQLVASPYAGELCELTVRDNGIGFDEKYADRIFGIFQRLHGRSAYDGTGIGLATRRKIVERHGGTIEARSTYRATYTSQM